MNVWNTPLQSQLTSWLLRRTPLGGVRRVVSLAAAIASEVGSVREENQDRVVIARGLDRAGHDFMVAAVADGMGGMRDGATCAALTAGTFLSALYQQAQNGSEDSEKWLDDAAAAANQAVFSQLRGQGGSTLVAVLVRPNQAACWLSVGDSRVYRCTGKVLTQVSVDDTIAGQLGKIVGAELDQSKLLQFIGMGDGLEAHFDKLDVNDPIDSVVLTSDGVHYLAPAPGLLGSIIGNAPDPGLCVKRLVDLSNWCGGHDNATVAMVSLKATSREGGGARDYRCLEVWDAFGELQIISSEASGIASPDEWQAPSLIRQVSTILAGAGALDAGTEPVTNHDLKLTPKTSKARRGKGARNTKSSADKDEGSAAKPSRPKAPQLRIDFQTKTNK